MSTDFRALCAEMAAELDHNRRCLLDDATLTHPLADRARAELAEQEADEPAVPEGREPVSVTGQPRPNPPAEGEVAELVAWLHGQDGGLGRRAIYARVAELLERLARWGNLKAGLTSPPAEGEVAEMVAWLRDKGRGAWPPPDGLSPSAQAEEYELYSGLTRAAELLERHVPVPVSERPWEREGWCDMDGECWWCPPDGPAYWSMVNPAMVYGGWLLPHWAIHQPPSVPALPLPAPQGGEVQP